VVALGHEIPEVDRITDENDRFTLVETTIGTQMAVETDPRKRGP
jgi:hypothetical protein